ncbi:DUF1345 domain-containing protein [Belnapia sp. T6]|uniref:DUF1345 domain-containing protein n=1 Tax=Belnapia mucosa TaxID=2804532 RepID=A0ABS1UXJ2_9PROT|nr:DUF1345 domain-containing protein [Belnapia mucosa]MBL6454186.1 DUF1345 domain-containing protein [Belnapia mucosa]
MIPAGLRRRPILAAAALLGLAVGLGCRLFGISGPSAVLFGWCAAVLGQAIPTFALMRRATPQSIRRRAEQLDEGETGVLFASLAAAIASLGAVLWYLDAAEGKPGGEQVALALLTIALSWGFVHHLFAVRYAHEYWQMGGAGLDFPKGPEGEGPPEFSDFLYFAFTVGMTFQTSDVAVSARLLRQLTLIHALVAFLFNAVILAAAVNLAAGLFT